MSERRHAFTDPQAVARYAEGPPRFVPGDHAMHCMTTLLIAEHAPDDARVLVRGAGGGLELKAFAQAHAGWTFDGVDPAAETLTLAEQTLGPLASRTSLRQATWQRMAGAVHPHSRGGHEVHCPPPAP